MIGSNLMGIPKNANSCSMASRLVGFEGAGSLPFNMKLKTRRKYRVSLNEDSVKKINLDNERR